MSFANLFKEQLINIELNIFDDKKIYEELTESYINNHENNELLKQTIKAYNFQREDQRKRYFINVLLKILLDKNLLWKTFSNEILKLIYWKINEILWNPEIDGEYLEFWVFFRLSPKKEDVIKLEEHFNLKHYLYKYFLRYYFSEKDYDKFCKSLKEYFKKYFSNENEYEFRYFILTDNDDSWFSIKEISDEFLLYFINHFENFLIILSKYEIHYTHIELICKYASKKLSKEFLKLFFNEYFNIHNFNIRLHIKSDQIEKLAKINSDDPEFLGYIYDNILTWKFQLFRWWQYVLKWTITENNIKIFFWYKWENYIVINLYYLYDKKDKIWQKIYKKYKTIIDDNQKINEQYKSLEQKNKLDEEKKIKESISQAIKKDKENNKNKKKEYPCREIIYLYNDYQNLFSTKEIEFVKQEIIWYFTSNKINIKWQETQVIQQNTNSFTIPRFIRDLIICCKHCENLWIDLSHYTDILIWLLPYLFDSDLNIILNQLIKYWVVELWKEDIEWLINIYLNNQHKDLNKFHNTRITDLISKWFINFSTLNTQQKEDIYQIYKNKLEDNENVQFREKQKFLESILIIKTFDKNRLYEKYYNISQLFMNYNYYEDYLLKNIDENISENYEYFLKFNEILIVLYNDKNCIKRRLNQLKWIKTDYIWESWEMRWLSKRDEEIFRSNSKNERFYTCIINAIEYPNYISDIKKILWIAKKFNAKEESYMWRYIYDFWIEYYKKVPEDKKLEEATKISDETFVKNYMLNIMNEKTRNEYKEHELQNLILNTYKSINSNKNNNEKISKLYNEREDLYNEQEKLKKIVEKQREELSKLKKYVFKNDIEITLYVEWKTDKVYIEKAQYILTKLFPKKFTWINNISIINCTSATNIPPIINSYIDDEKIWIHIWIFDIDLWWINAWANQIYRNYTYWDRNNLWECWLKWKIFENKYKRNNQNLYSFILLPYTKNFESQIFTDNVENTIENDERNPKNFLKNKNVMINNFPLPVFTIEHLLYCPETSQFFWDEITFWNKKIVKIKNKIGMLEYIKSNEIPNDIRKNFLPLFEYIQNIHNEFKNNFTN